MKDCLIIGNKNAVTTKYVFPLLKDRVLKTGYTIPRDYTQPEWCETKTLNGLTRWFTTLPVTDKEPLVLTAHYSPEKYPKYDNYNAINVDSIKDIPFDYSGVMGVPITILDKNLDNVEILWRSGDIEWAENECDFFTPPAEEQGKNYKEQDRTWRVQNPYLLSGSTASTVYNRVFIKVEGLLYGDYTEIDGEYIKGHTPIINGKHKYGSVLIKKEMKKFIIIGNQNAIGTKEIFPYIKDDKIWLGVSMNGANRWFMVPDKYEFWDNAANSKIENGKKMLFVNGVVWFTNISNEKRNAKLDLFRKYSNEYPHYDNFNAIEVSRVENIPADYDGAMGVPISFLHKYNPEQFEIVGIAQGSEEMAGEYYLGTVPTIKYDGGKARAYLNGKSVYTRILIKRRGQ